MAPGAVGRLLEQVGKYPAAATQQNVAGLQALTQRLVVGERGLERKGLGCERHAVIMR